MCKNERRYDVNFHLIIAEADTRPCSYIHAYTFSYSCSRVFVILIFHYVLLCLNVRLYVLLSLKIVHIEISYCKQLWTSIRQVTCWAKEKKNTWFLYVSYNELYSTICVHIQVNLDAYDFGFVYRHWVLAGYIKSVVQFWHAWSQLNYVVCVRRAENIIYWFWLSFWNQQHEFVLLVTYITNLVAHYFSLAHLYP